MRNNRSETKFVLNILLAAAMTCMIAGCAATGKSFVMSTPTSDKGLIYVYRPPQTMTGGLSWNLSANGVRLTVVKNGGYFPYYAAPGNVTFSAKKRPGLGDLIVLEAEKELITINVEPGEVYFVRFTFHRGAFVAGAVMEIVDKSTGEAEILDLKLLEPWQQ